jgi:hypothetical protein
VRSTRCAARRPVADPPNKLAIATRCSQALCTFRTSGATHGASLARVA